MADDYRAERVLGVPRMTEFPAQHDTPQRRGYSAYASSPREPPLTHSLHDVASVLGLAPERLAPDVLAAVMTLMADNEQLHRDAEQAERRRAWLERDGDRHSVVPCLNRRAFMRELGQALDRGDGGMLALLHVGGIERLRLVHGMAAGEGALRHACAAIVGSLRSSDMVGCLGGSDFGLLLIGSDEAGAHEKLGDVCRRINAPAYTWLGQPMILVTLVGLYGLTGGDGAEQALAAADRVRRGLD